MYFLAKIILIFLLISFSGCTKSDVSESKDFEVKINNPQLISLCELATNPEKFEGKTVILKSVYMLQFEASHFVTFSCKPKIAITANFDAPPCSEKSEIEAWDWSSPMTNRAHGVVVKGWFDNKMVKGRSTGELPEYYEFNVDCIDEIKQLGTFVVYPKEKEEIIRKKIEDFEKDKSENKR